MEHMPFYRHNPQFGLEESQALEILLIADLQTLNAPPNPNDKEQ